MEPRCNIRMSTIPIYISKAQAYRSNCVNIHPKKVPDKAKDEREHHEATEYVAPETRQHEVVDALQRPLAGA